MAYLNKVMLIGNIGKDPVISASATGRKRVSFSLATSRRYRDNNGEQKEQTDWHNIVGWGKIADTMETLGVHKGMTLYVEGSLTNRSWTDQTTGQKRYSTEVNLDSSLMPPAALVRKSTLAPIARMTRTGTKTAATSREATPTASPTTLARQVRPLTMLRHRKASTTTYRSKK